MSYSSIFWLPLCAVLTGLGLVMSYYVGRRRGYRAMLRGAAWSLIPIAAYLTGSIEMFWKIGAAIGKFASAFVFSPVKWAGIGVAGAAVVLFLTTSGRERRKAARQKAAARAGEKKSAGASAAPAGLSSASTVSPGALATTVTLPAARKAEPTKTAGPKHSGKTGKAAASPLGDDMKDIEDILRDRGI